MEQDVLVTVGPPARPGAARAARSLLAGVVLPAALAGCGAGASSAVPLRSALGVRTASPVAHPMPAGARAQTVASAPQVADGALAFYRLDEPSGTLARDASGHGNDGTYVGRVTHQIPGVTGDGDGAIETAYLADVKTAFRQPSAGGGFSVDFWANFDDVDEPNADDFRDLVASCSPFSGERCGVEIWYQPASGCVNADVYTSTNPWRRVWTCTAAKGWHHYAAVYAASGSWQIYRDGTLQMTETGGSGPIVAGAQPFAIGAQPNGTTFAGDVKFDEVAFYGSALSAAQVERHFAAGTRAVVVDPSEALVETPVPTARFLDSIGFNTHLHYENTAYGDYTRVVKPAVQSIGIMHIRDSGTDATSVAEVNDLHGSLGVTVLGGWDDNVHVLLSAADCRGLQPPAYAPNAPRPWPWSDCSDVLTKLRQSPGAYDGAESYNEYNGAEPNWVATLRLYTQGLHSVLQGTPYANLAVVAPSYTAYGSAQQVGSLAGSAAYNNIYPYDYGGFPGDENLGSISGTIGSTPRAAGSTRPRWAGRRAATPAWGSADAR